MADEEKCPHCAAPREALLETKDGSAWLCAKCERWSNTTACPTCGQPVAFAVLAERQKGD
jgi:RNA polymerase subunit RPABC4/transcription elongation factor Spt4